MSLRQKHRIPRRRLLKGLGSLAAASTLPATAWSQVSGFETDVLIIGGGIAGASTAFHLAEQGRDVVLLERGEIASEASGQNMGGLGGNGWGSNCLLYTSDAADE